MSCLSGLRFIAARRLGSGGLLCLAALFTPLLLFAHDEHTDRVAPVSVAELAATQTPEVSEGYVPPAPKSGLVEASLFGAFGSSAQQRSGALSGKIVYMNSGHGWPLIRSTALFLTSGQRSGSF